MNAPIIRRALPADAGVVRDIVHTAYRHYIARIGTPPGPMLDDYAVRIAAGQTWVAIDAAGAIGGILVLEDQPDGAVLLDNIAVAPDRQGSGLGRALLIFAEAEAIGRGARLIRLYTNEMMVENIALYARVGYVEVRRVSEKGFRRVYMEKTLMKKIGT